MHSDSPSTNDSSERQQRVTQILDKVIDRRLAGEDVPDEVIVAEHPELMPELGERLRDIQRIEQAAKRADAQASSAPGQTGAVQGPSQTPPTISFPGYRVVREIARGGQGIVYEAIQEATQRTVAIKVIREGPWDGSRGKARFEREVQILAAFKHPHIVTIHDCGSTAGYFYYVMDFITGESLDEYVRSWIAGSQSQPSLDRITLAELVRLLIKVCAAVNVAHLRGVIHRDLKPSNIHVDRSGEPHILDFGLAKVAEFDVLAGSESRDVTQTGQIVGSLPWASPEQAEGRPEHVDTRTDVYALGVILYQILTGRFPYEVSGSMRQRLDAILYAEPAKPRTICPHIDDELETIILKCLSKEQERRYQTAGELARDLTRYLAGEAIEAKRDSTLYVVRKQLSRHKWPVGVAAVFLVMVMGFAVAMSVQAARNRRLAENEKTARHAAMASKEAAERSRDRAFVAERRATRINEFLQTMLASVDPEIAQGRDDTLLSAILESAAQRVDTELADEPEVQAAVREVIGGTYASLARYDAALPLLESALAFHREALGDEHRQTLIALTTLMDVYRRVGRLAEAEAACRKIVEVMQETRPEGDPELATTINNLAVVLCDQGKLDEATGMYERAVEAFRRAEGPESRNTLGVSYNLGQLLITRRRFAEAETHLRELLEIGRRVLGDTDPVTMAAMSSLVTPLLESGREAEAEALAREAVELYRQVYSDEHPETLIAESDWARTLAVQGRWEEVEPIRRKCWETARRVLPPGHLHTAIYESSYGACLTKLRRFEEAERHLLAAYRVQAEQLGLGDERTQSPVRKLVELYEAWGKSAMAAEYGALLRCKEAEVPYGPNTRPASRRSVP